MDKMNDYLTIWDVARIVRRYRVMIFGIVVGFVVVGTGVYASLPQAYRATLLVDIVRVAQNSNSQIAQIGNLELKSAKDEGGLTQIVQNSIESSNSAYQYDGYYRLKADEQMGETVVNWLKTPRVTSDIVNLAIEDLNASSSAGNLPNVNLRKFFVSHRISPQSVQVAYRVPKQAQADAIAKSLVEYTNARIKLLSGDGSFAQFAVRADAPIVGDAAKPLWMMALLFAGIGAFVAFWSVLVRYGLRKR